MHSETERVLREMAKIGQKIANMDCGPRIAERAVSYLAALNELVNEPPVLLEQGPRVEEILAAVCHQFHLDQAELLGRGRTQRVVNIRFVAMYLVKKMTPMSYPEIGRLFGRDHSTVIYAVKQIEKRAFQVPKFGMTLEKMRRDLVAAPLVEAAA